MILGIDPSTKKVAIVSVIGGRFVAEAYPLADRKTDSFTPEASRRAYEAVNLFLWDNWAKKMRRLGNGHLVAVIEEPVVGIGGIRSSLKQAYIGGAVHTALREWEFEVVIKSNTTWKKEVVGNGGTKKEGVASWLKENHPEWFELCGQDQDLIDATCIFLSGYTYRRK